MTGSRVNFFVCAVLLLLSPFQVSAAEPDNSGPATAPPRGLTQPDAPPVVEEEQLPAGPSAPAEETLPDKPGAPSGPRVTMTGLSAIDPAGAGLVGPNSGGFAPTLWSGSARIAVASRIAQLPAAPNSPAMQGLTRRLLLTTAQPPSGVTPPDEPSFLGLRLARMLANGWLEESAMLAGQSPRDDSFARQTAAEALLLQGRDADACSDTTSLREQSNNPYWLKLRVVCYVQQQNMPAATLTLDVMRERGIEDDVFFALAGAVTEGSAAPKVAALPKPSGVHLALLRQASVTPPAALAGWVPATALLSQSTDPDIRLTAAERAAVAGLAPADQLRVIYDAEAFTPDQLDDPEEWAPKLPPARANALYFQAITKRTLPAARAAAFAAALQRAESQNRFALFASMADELALKIQPAPDTAWLAPYVVRVLLYAGKDKAAERWLAILASPTDGPTVNAIQIHLALVRPTTENVARLQGAMTWLGQNALKPGGAKDWLMDRATREIPLLEALGYIVPPDAQWAVSATTAGVVPSGAAAEALIAIPRTAQEGRVGETVTNALVALGPGGPARAQGQTVTRVVKALMAVGLRDEARALATEAVLATPVKLRK
jgi:hypothetical protein